MKRIVVTGRERHWFEMAQEEFITGRRKHWRDVRRTQKPAVLRFRRQDKEEVSQYDEQIRL